MEAHCADALLSLTIPRPLLGFRLHVFCPSPRFPSSMPTVSPSLLCSSRRHQDGKLTAGGREKVKVKQKENVWSIDNELASKSAAEDKKGLGRRRRKNVKTAKDSRRRRSGDSTVMVSAAMLVEIETVLQTQEPVIKPSWDTFTSSLCGIWKGVGAVFSPFTAELEPIDVGVQNEKLFDCYTLSHIEKTPSQGMVSLIHRKTHWVALNPFGEARKHAHASHRGAGSDKSTIPGKVILSGGDMEFDLPSYESFELGCGEISEEDSMSMEPGLIFFESAKLLSCFEADLAERDSSLEDKS
ncbi:hypothetical protein KSP39_PZI004424 [Platanthera zijinensis]|uniref:Uncharacterized protein n=1 Tax=Platanthera zijinensis TaxID=2320716 RepID=A0AAP0BWC7_9ASPA